jgi:hypothetical protein
MILVFVVARRNLKSVVGINKAVFLNSTLLASD